MSWKSGIQFSAAGVRFFFFPKCPCQLWDLSSLIFYGYWGFFPGGKVAGVWHWALPAPCL